MTIYAIVVIIRHGSC